MNGASVLRKIQADLPVDYIIGVFNAGSMDEARLQAVMEQLQMRDTIKIMTISDGDIASQMEDKEQMGDLSKLLADSDWCEVIYNYRN